MRRMPEPPRCPVCDKPMKRIIGRLYQCPDHPDQLERLSDKPDPGGDSPKFTHGTIEDWKTMNVVEAGMVSIVRSLRPDISPDLIPSVVKKLREICGGLTDVTELTACIYENLDRVVAETREEKARG